MSGSNFFKELKRRNVYRVAATYAVVAWLLIQVGSILFPVFDAPDWVMKVMTLLLIFGFPIAMILAWAFEMSPGGIVRTTSSDGEISAPSGKRGNLTSNIFIGILLTIIVGQYAYQTVQSNRKLKTDNILSSEIISERIAVVPFENLTSEPSLDNLGKIASNYINLGLVDIESAEVVSPYTVQSNLESLGVLPNDPEGRKSFSELTGAKNLISGNYFVTSDSMITFVLQIQDAITGEMKFAFPEVSGTRAHKEDMIGQLLERVTGYWITKELVSTQVIRPPNFSAYNKYLEFLAMPVDPVLFEEVITLDSTFYLARIQFLNLSRWLRHPSKPNHFAFLERHLNHMTNYEKKLFEFVKNLYAGNSQTSFRIVDELRQRFPKDFNLNHDAAGIAFDELNNFKLSQEIYDQLPINTLPDEVHGPMGPRIRNEIVMKSISGDQNAFDQYVKQTEHRKTGLKFFLDPLKAILSQDQAAYQQILMSKLDEADSPGEKYQQLLSHFSWDFRSTIPTPEMNEFLINQSRQIAQSAPEGGPARETLLQILRVIDEQTVQFSKKLFIEDDESKATHSTYPSYLYWTALGFIQNNQMDQVPAIIEELNQFIIEDLTIAVSYGAALPLYDIGCIYAKMNDTDSAMSYLTKARNYGLFSGHFKFKYDKHLSSLFDHPEFIELNKPIWPKILD